MPAGAPERGRSFAGQIVMWIETPKVSALRSYSSCPHQT